MPPPQCSHLGASSHSGCQGSGFQHNKNNTRAINLFQERSLMQGYPAKLFQAATVLADGGCMCPAYCTFPCKGLPHSLLCSEVASGLLPHTCWQKGPHNTHSWNPTPKAFLGAPQQDTMALNKRRCSQGRSWAAALWCCGAGTWFSGHAEAMLLYRTVLKPALLCRSSAVSQGLGLGRVTGEPGSAQVPNSAIHQRS